MPNTFFQVGRISVAVKTHLEIRLGICIYKTSLLHRPDGYIGFTRSCPPTFYNKIAPMVGSDNNWRRLQILETSLIQEHKPELNANIPSMPLYIFTWNRASCLTHDVTRHHHPRVSSWVMRLRVLRAISSLPKQPFAFFIFRSTFLLSD